MRNFILLLFLTPSLLVFSQRFLKGNVVDEGNNAVPFAKIYVKNDPDQRTVSDANGYFEMGLMPGEYYLVLEALGYEKREFYLGMGDLDVTKEFKLFMPKAKEIEAIVISGKKSNPGREIMLKVVEKRDKMNPWNYPHTVDVYIKASEKIEVKQEQKPKEEEKENEKLSGQTISKRVHR